MAQQRIYLVTSTAGAPAFNGTTVFTGSWSPPSNTAAYANKNNKFNRATTTTSVGRFSPDALGSTKNPTRMVRAYSNGPFTAGDQYLVRSSADPTLGQPVSIVREAARVLGSSLNDAMPLLVGPTDDFCVTMAGDGVAASIHVIVDDVSEAEWAAINAALIAAAAANVATTFETRVLTAPDTIDSWVGTLFVSGIATTAGDSFTLPPLADVAIGARLVLFRTDDATGRWFDLVPAGADTINGSVEPLRFSAAAQGITLERTSVGWSANATADDATAVAITNDATLAIPYRQRTRIEWDINQAGAGTLTLPSQANVAVGQAFLISLLTIAGGAPSGAVIPTAGQTLDGVVNKAVTLGRAGDSVVIERVPGGWVSTTSHILTTETRQVSVDAGPVDILVWTTDVLYVEARATVASGTLRLPALAGVPIGAKLRIARTDALVVSQHFVLIASGVETINASQSPLRFAYNAMGVWIERGPNGWLATSAPDNVNPVVAAGTAVLALSSRLRTLVEWTPGADDTLTLPTIASMAIDQEIEVMCMLASAGGTVIPAAGEGVDGVADKATPLVRAGDSVVFRRTLTGGWGSTLNYNPLNRDTIAVIADPALGLSVGWDGVRHYRCTYPAAPGDFTLPTNPKLGTEIVVSQANANTVTLQAGANVIIAEGTAVATLALAINRPIHLIFFTGAWVQL